MNYVMKNKSELLPSEIVDASRMQREKQHGKRWRNYKFPPGKDKIFLELKNLSEDGVITWENEKGGRGLKSKIKIAGNTQRNDKYLAESGILDALGGVDELEKITDSGNVFKKEDFVKFVITRNAAEGAWSAYNKNGRATEGKKHRLGNISLYQKEVYKRLEKLKNRQKRRLEKDTLSNNFDEIVACIVDIMRNPAVVTKNEDQSFKAKMAELDDYLSL